MPTGQQILPREFKFAKDGKFLPVLVSVLDSTHKEAAIFSSSDRFCLAPA
jgi:hypothetical protein